MRTEGPLSIVIVGVSNFLALAPITVEGYPDYAAWSLGTGWLLCILILFRGGATLAWVGMGALGVSTCVWALVSGRGAVVALQLIVGQAVALFLWTLVAWWGQKLFKSTAETQVQIRNTEALRVSTQAMTALLEERLEKVARRARPVLERLASDEPLDSEARLAAKVLEGELRDEIRAPALCDEQLVEAARDARRRGLEVVLLDDRGEVPLDDDLMNVVRSKGLEALRGATEGRVVIRLLPAGRKNIASIVAPGRTVTVGE